jgi:hypothetical protein
MLDDCKFGWNFRNFYIDTDERPKENKPGQPND